MSELTRRSFLRLARDATVAVTVAPILAALPHAAKVEASSGRLKRLPDKMPTTTLSPEVLNRMRAATVMVGSDLKPWDTQPPFTGVVVAPNRVLTTSEAARRLDAHEDVDGKWSYRPVEGLHALVGHPQSGVGERGFLRGRVSHRDDSSRVAIVEFDVSNGGFEVGSRSKKPLQPGDSAVALSYEYLKHPQEGSDALVIAQQMYIGDIKTPDGLLQHVFVAGIGHDRGKLHNAMVNVQYGPRDDRRVIDEAESPSVLTPWEAEGSPIFNEAGEISGIVTQVFSPAKAWYDSYRVGEARSVLSSLGYEIPNDPKQIPDVILAAPISVVDRMPAFTPHEPQL